IPLFMLSDLWEAQQWIHLQLSDWLFLGYATLFGSAIAYGLFFYFASTGNLTSLSSLTFLTPVFALLFGNLFLAEVLSPVQWTGVCLTLVSIYLVNQRERLGSLKQVGNIELSPSTTKAYRAYPDPIEQPVKTSKSELETS
ncbi:MAG TPA: DMT family transporter, partial [Candidatus Caenarcaniphilales bacterium]